MTHTPKILVAFSEDQACRLTGLTSHQLRYWDRTDFFSPSFADGEWKRSFGRVYSFRDIVALRVLGVLRNQYRVSVQHLRDVKERLRPRVSTRDDLWTGVTLYVLNRRVYWVEQGDTLPSGVATGQYVVPTIDFDRVVNQTQGDATGLLQRRPETVGHIERVKLVNQRAEVLAGTRIPVRAIKRFSEAGYSTEQILREYPDLSEEDVAAALAHKLAA